MGKVWLFVGREEPSSDSVDSFIPQRDTGFMGGQVSFESPGVEINNSGVNINNF